MAKLPYVDQNGLVRVWSKMKEYVQTAISGLYTKPLDGIPSTDMTTEVQTSLGKADTALQSFTETDPTVPAWAKAAEKPTYTAAEVGALPDDTELFSGSYNDLTDKPTIPDSLSDLSDDSTHRLVTDAEKTAWNGKSDFSGSYDDLTDKPTIPDAQVQSDWTEADSTKVDYIKNKPSLATVATSGSYNDLSNTPTIPTVPTISTDISSDATSDTKTASPKAVKTFVEGKGYITSAHEVPSGGNAGQVLSKNSATDYDVHWVNQTITYPSAYSTTAGGTAAKKASCSLYALQTNSYVHVLMGGSNTYAGALTLSINSTTAKPIYINGAASSSTNYTLPSGTYIVFYDGTNYYFRTDGKIQGLNGTLVCTSSTSGLIKNDGTIDTNTYLTQHQDISGKADKATTLSGYGITDAKISYGVITLGSNSITPLTSHQDISGKADKSEMSVSASGDQTTITLKSGTSATVINQHQSLSGYVQTSNTAGLIKNDGTIDTTSYGTYSKPSGGIPASDIASGVIPVVPSNIVVGNSQSYTIWSGTQAEYDALATKDNNTIYLIKES